MAKVTIARENFVGLVVLGDTAKQIATAFEQAGTHLILYADTLKEAVNLAIHLPRRGMCCIRRLVPVSICLVIMKKEDEFSNT